MNPSWQQKKLMEFCREKGMLITGYTPLGASRMPWGSNRVLESNVLKEIAMATGKTTAQVIPIFLKFYLWNASMLAFLEIYLYVSSKERKTLLNLVAHFPKLNFVLSLIIITFFF